MSLHEITAGPSTNEPDPDLIRIPAPARRDPYTAAAQSNTVIAG
jgi:hypothetical protein